MTVFERRLSVTSVTPPLPSLQHWHSTFLLRDSECRSWLRPRFLSSVHHSPFTRHHAPRTTHHAPCNSSTQHRYATMHDFSSRKLEALRAFTYWLSLRLLLPQLPASTSCFLLYASSSCFQLQRPASASLLHLPFFTLLHLLCSASAHCFSLLPQLTASYSCLSFIMPVLHYYAIDTTSLGHLSERTKRGMPEIAKQQEDTIKNKYSPGSRAL